MKEFEKKIIAVTTKLLRNKERCPVLYYHDVVEDGKEHSYQKIGFSVFENQMRYIAENGIRTCTFDELTKNPDFLKSENCALICFDDGYISNYIYAYPICKKIGIKFNIFIQGKAIADQQKGYMTEEQIRELYESGIVGIGAHTWNHIDCRKLCQANWEEEIVQENSYLKELLGINEVTDFCFPYGLCDSESVKLLAENNAYYRLYTSDGIKQRKAGNTLLVGRIAVEANDSIQTFSDKVHGNFAAYRLYHPIIKTARKLINHDPEREGR